eukprot:c11195_g1_i2 orf=195-419(+)
MQQYSPLLRKVLIKDQSNQWAQKSLGLMPIFSRQIENQSWSKTLAIMLQCHPPRPLPNFITSWKMKKKNEIANN